ncbi:uncharacterized protein PHACADRAFT_211615 [Phanerochaete carnosa HHB-10118-sp]|uniref:Uncharacterized protein n=1 Tax=Phanerochaete carnosa (strain HHB-10118-sp) TaxID=650164 RepID=K5W0G5_PHACS|nr:uncharacterized protein PHACADRAFT_211615 [Phanerochaete carnosa HHB-10118-sp]EKM52349.1 hypothetical protein PHACADRAFT_211615 [Phanerochaete carnosa HHB-10118-sp]
MAVAAEEWTLHSPPSMQTLVSTHVKHVVVPFQSPASHVLHDFQYNPLMHTTVPLSAQEEEGSEDADVEEDSRIVEEGDDENADVEEDSRIVEGDVEYELDLNLIGDAPPACSLITPPPLPIRALHPTILLEECACQQDQAAAPISSSSASETSSVSLEADYSIEFIS